MRSYDGRMIPIGDYLRTRSPAYVNWSLIIVNIAVFLYMIVTYSTQPDRLVAGLPTSPADRFVIDWGFVPACVAHYFGVATNASPRDLAQVCPPGDRELIQPITAMFVHAGWVHIGGNMLFLWIFGDNVEDNMGHLRYLLFYFLCGIAAAVTQTAFSLNSTVPAVGASGAIAGVLAAYLILYPKAMVRVIFLPLFFLPFVLPAVILIGIWFVIQVFSGIASIGNANAGSGVAWWAHVGGFTAGAVLILLFRRRRPARVPAAWSWTPS
jgi:rhomboid family protein